MEVLTPKAVRRSTRLRVEIPVSVLSLDRRRPYGERCLLLVVSAQGCGFRSSEQLQMGTPLMLSGLPGGGSVTGQVANCVPLGNDGQFFLVGVSLYTHGNVWGIADPPEDWGVVAKNDSAPASSPTAAEPSTKPLAARKKSWPYNLFSEGAETHPGHK
ncbi:MAG TPA: PilZ domain-containing protein [Candidatus Sulfotelmatobacter sp.]|nr:PilZ domain-containing protein [Candidatus Sulfotelmatobacter sp.]